jgi:hypothetical protein
MSVSRLLTKIRNDFIFSNYFNNMSAVKSGKKYNLKIKTSLSNSIIEQSDKLLSELKQSLKTKKTEW